MQRGLLEVCNRKRLEREAELRPLLEWLASAIAPGRRLREIAPVVLADGAALRGWSRLVDARGEGVAIGPRSFEPAASALRATLVQAQLAQRLSQRVAQLAPVSTVLCDGAPGLEQWSGFRLELEGGCCEVACSEGATVLVGAQEGRWGADPQVWLTVAVDRLSQESLGVLLREIPVVLPEIGKRGVVYVSSEGGVHMRIEPDDVPEDARCSSAIRVRLELGEMELGLRELMGLRPGSVIELGADFPLECSMVVGASVLAHGAVEVVEGGLRVRVTGVAE